MTRDVKMGALIMWKSPTNREIDADIGVIVRGAIDGVVIANMQRTGTHPLRVDAIAANGCTFVE